MTIEKRIEAAQKLIEEVKAELAAKAAPRRNWPEKVEAGDCFEIPTFGTWMSLGNYGYACISGDRVGAHAEDISGTGVVYLGHARDVITIRTDAHKPTGAELVGKMCEVSNNGTHWFDKRTITEYRIGSDEPYFGIRTWKYARLAR